LAQELHFGRAAGRLNITQPSLSQMIRDLETRLGCRLVERTTRKVILTNAGRSFLSDAEAILLHLDRAVANAQAEAGQAANTIRIGAILPATFEFLPAVLSRFRQRYPAADVHIETKDSPNLVRAVESGQLHVALLRAPKNAGTLCLETVRRDPFVAAMRSEHRLARKQTLELADLRNERLLPISRGDLRDAFDDINRQLENAGIDLAQSHATETTLTAISLVCAGDGISLVPSWAASLPWKEVCFREVRDLTATIDLAVVWESSNLPPIAEHFIEIARRAAKQAGTQ
jgi:DNA-binding transcriptional LysR family regulator